MSLKGNSFLRCILSVLAAGTVLISLGCTKKSRTQPTTDLMVDVMTPFRFVVYGDTRFHDPSDIEAANPEVRRTLVQAIADANPAFIGFTGDIVYIGDDAEDWKVWESETKIWRDKRIPIFPALGNHDLHANESVALENYFQHFPDLKGSRFYSVRIANVLMLVLDSSMEELAGPQGEWLKDKLNHIPEDLEFVFIMDHHPPYTSSSDENKVSGGHSARPREQALANMLEERQAHSRYRIVFFSGHVHNYERHQHGGVTYFVSGGGGAHPYLIERTSHDLFQSNDINYHYLLVEVDRQRVKVTMNRLQLTDGKASWTTPDQVDISNQGVTAKDGAH